MGTEYKLLFRYPSRGDVVSSLSKLPDITRSSAPYNGFELRRKETAGRIPDAALSVEEYGLYFCDNGGYGGEYLARVVSNLVADFGNVEVVDYE